MYSYNKASLILTLLGLFFSWTVSQSQEPLVKKTSSGKPYYLRTNNKDHSINFYDSVVPLIFEFKTPNWSDPISLIGYSCTGDDYETDGYSCPVLWYWLTQVRDVIQQDIFVSSLQTPDSSSFKPTNIVCDRLRPFFQGLYLNPQAREEFYQELQTNCQRNQTIRLPLSEKYIADNIDQPYKTMREKFFEEYYSLQTPVNRSNDAIYTNARYNLYSSGLFHYYAEARRWKDALQECKSRRIPSTLISNADLSLNIEKISNEYATPNGYTLTVPVSNLSVYYRGEESLADCVFTENSLIVVVQVPLTKVSSSVQSLELISVPTREQMDEILCYIDNIEEEELFLKEDSTFVGNKRVISIKDLECSGKFCKVKRSRSWPVRKSCAQAMVEGKDEDEICGWKCLSSHSFEYPMIRQISSDRFLVVGEPLVKEILVECPLYQKEEILEIPSSGIVELTLPCDCFLRNGDDIFKAQDQCGSELIQVPIDYPFFIKATEK